MRVLLLDEELATMLLPIDDNLAKGYVRPAIILAQDMFVEATLGTQLTQKLQSLVVEKKEQKQPIPQPYADLLDELQKMLAHYACAFIIENVGSKIANAGVLRTEDEKMYSLSANEIAERKNTEIHYGDMYRGRLQRYLIANYQSFPELREWRSIADLRVQLYSSATCGLWLGGARGKGFATTAEESYGLNLPGKKETNK